MIEMKQVRRMVVKVGTAVIAVGSGSINHRRVENLVDQLAEARRRDVQVALVSSGAIAAGIEKMGLSSRPADIQDLQAIAAVGQGILVQMYAGKLEEKGITTGQVLLTQYDMTHRQQYLNARHTLERLFRMGVVPIINENDTVATEEIAFGENDLLAALVSALVEADVLVLLTDTGGLYTADPHKNKNAKLLERVDCITGELERLAGETGSEMASGGMSSKIQAVKAAVSAGVSAVIADGRSPRVIIDILDGKQAGTFFPSKGKVTSRKHWIGYAKKSRGRLIIDPGAARAISTEGRSLLPAGVVEVDGDFHVGDAVDIVDRDGKVIGRGLSNYDIDEARKILGLRSQQVMELLGEKEQEIIHRDGMVIFEGNVPAEKDDR